MRTIPNFPVDTAKMGSVTRTRIAIKPTDGIKTGATGATTGVISLANHTFVEGDIVEYTSGTGFTGLVAGTFYHVRDVVADTSFKLAAAAGGEAVALTAVGEAGTFALIIGYETAKADDNSQAPAEDSVEMPDDLGQYYPVLTSYGSAKEAYTFITHEVLRLVKIFRGAMQGTRLGQAKLWMPSAQLAQAGIATPFLESEWFPCAVTRGADVTYGDKKASVTTIKISSQKRGAVTWTPYTA